MLAGDRASVADADAEDVTGHLLGLLLFAGDTGVEEHERMEVAVAGVEDIGDPQAVLGSQIGDLLQDAGDLLARNDAVLHEVIAADPAHCGEGALAAFPHQLALGGVARDADLHRAALARQLDGPLGGVLAFRQRTVDVHQERRAHFGPVDARGGFGGDDGERIHHLDGGGHDARGDDGRDRVARLFVGRERREEGARGFGLAQDAQHHFGHDPEQPLAADDHAEQVVTWLIERRAADGDDLAVGEDHANAEDMIDGEAVLEAVRAAAVLGDVAADGADALRRGIGRVVPAIGSDVLGDVEVGDARLHAHEGVAQIDLEELLHPRQADQRAARDRHRAARQARAGAARHDRQARGAGDLHHLGDFLAGGRQQHDARRDAIGGEAVGFVDPEILGLADDVLFAHCGAEAGDHLRRQPLRRRLEMRLGPSRFLLVEVVRRGRAAVLRLSPRRHGILSRLARGGRRSLREAPVESKAFRASSPGGWSRRAVSRGSRRLTPLRESTFLLPPSERNREGSCGRNCS